MTIAAVTASKPARPSLAQSVKRGVQSAPLRVLLFGVEGIGKTHFAASAPSPIFLGTEDGFGQLEVARFPMPATWSDVIADIRQLATEEHEFKTLVIDTLDHLEPLCWEQVCAGENARSIEKVGGGFGKGYIAALEEWRRLTKDLEALRRKDMHVILLAHSTVRTFKNPEGADFDRYNLKLQDRAAGFFKEWSDIVLFANYETFVEKDSTSKKPGKGFSADNARMIFTERRAAFDAKNRHNLPAKMPLSWEEFASAVNLTAPEQAAKCTELRAQIEQRRDALGDADMSTKVNALLEKHAANISKLSEINNRLAAKIAEKDQASS